MRGPPRENVSISTSLPFDNKCICAFHSQSICFFDTKLWFCLINKKLSKTTPFVQVFRKNWKKKRFGAKKRSKSTFSPYKYYRHVSSTMSVLQIYTVKYSSFEHFSRQTKNESQTFEKALLAIVFL